MKADRAELFELHCDSSSSFRATHLSIRGANRWEQQSHHYPAGKHRHFTIDRC